MSTELNVPIDSLWAGTEDALLAHLARAQVIAGRMKAGGEGWDGSAPASGEKPLPYLLQIHGNVGLVSIKGPLTNSTSPWDRYDGAATYPAIREALIEAAKNPAVAHILLDVDSGGGQVSGVEDTASLIQRIDQGIKPVHAFSGGYVASGAYWLAASARSLHVGATAVAGSIGVIMTHVERSKMFAAAGITVTQIRAGKFKQLANPFEPLTEVAKAELEAMAQSIYSVFLAHVAEVRGKPVDYVDQHMGQGRVFIGASAVTVGLADGISSIDELVSSISTKQLTSYPRALSTNIPGVSMPVLTDVQIAALAEGGAALAAVAATDAAAAIAATAATAAAALAATAAIAAAPPAAVTLVADTATLQAAVAAAGVDAASIAMLKTQLVERDDALFKAKLDAHNATAALASANETITGLAAIARKSVGNMTIALGGAAAGLDALTGASLLARHTEVSANFATRFPVGGVAAVLPTEGARAPQAVVDARFKAQLAATQATSAR